MNTQRTTGVTLAVTGLLGMPMVHLTNQPLQLTLFMMAVMLFGGGMLALSTLVGIAERLAQMNRKLDRMDASG